MIPLLPKWNLHNNRPTFYDTDSVTMLELAGRLHGAMNELITEYNGFVEQANHLITEFMQDQNQDREAFATALRQEFQDFIDVVNLKYSEQEGRINNAIAGNIAQIEAATARAIADISGAVTDALSAEY